MKVVSSLPRRIREIENVFIPMPDGCRLAARIWMPEDAEAWPVPAVLEYIPYRKRDAMRSRDDTIHPYFAGHGYASVRVDLRGSGDSDGVLTDEYLEQELADGEDVIAWLARQPWCSGRVGMIGISWGGFNGLQIAARRPEALGAVITLCSTDDRYSDDVHYMGGCLLGDNLSWAGVMFSLNTCPPDPEIVGEDWESSWRERLEGSGLWLRTWLEHQHRDAYWRHGSVCEDFSAIEVPVLAGSGWADGYTNAVFRLLDGLEVPRQGIIGPWSHKYPHIGVPGPAIGFLQHAVRWWDRWLKGIENGIDEEPMLRVYVQDPTPPSTGYATRPGRWVHEPSWPSPRLEERVYTLAPSGLASSADVPRERFDVQSPLSLGLFGGKWCSYSAPPDLPDDQREEDGGALVFDTPWLEERVEVLGAPVLDLWMSADRPVAMLAARLSDIAPDGKVTRVSFGLLNLTHRASHEAPEPLEPGQWFRVRLRLNHIGQAFDPGHRIRIAISSSYWPIAWPPPEPVTLSVLTRESRLLLPVRPSLVDAREALPFAGPEGSAPTPMTAISEGEEAWRVIRDLASDAATLEVVSDSGRERVEPIDLEMCARCVERYFVAQNDPNSMRAETEWHRRFERGDWLIETRARMLLTSTPSVFRLTAEIDAWSSGTRVFCQSWEEEIPRRLV